MTVKRASLWLTATALGAFLPAASAFAADMPLKAAPIAPAYYDWSGVYVGVHAGYGGGMKDWNDEGFDFAARGFLGGGQVGINKQIGSLVFGLELDGSWANLNHAQTLTENIPTFGFTGSLSATSRIEGLATFAGRAGLAADRWFVYAKGGLALAHETHSLNSTVNDVGVVSSESLSASDDRWGPMFGVGAEYALGGNWSVKAEYDYIRFGTRSPTFTGSGTNAGVTTPIRFDAEIEQTAIHLAKVGVNYRFGGIQLGPSFAPARAAPGYNWSGAYVGAQGGYGVGHKAWPDFFDAANPDTGKFDVKGWLAGGTAGVNAQAGVFVFGVEGEWMWTGINGSQVTTQSGMGVETTSLASKVDWLAIASARAGFVVGDRLLIYGKAGVALANENHAFDRTQTIPLGSVVSNASGHALHTGIVAGAGAEYALGGNWSAKIEYDYIRMDPQSFATTGTETLSFAPFNGATLSFPQRFEIQQDMHIVKFGVNYHFNPMPVVVSARY
jgi:outer membrane immunogenic protein